MGRESLVLEFGFGDGLEEGEAAAVGDCFQGYLESGLGH